MNKTNDITKYSLHLIFTLYLNRVTSVLEIFPFLVFINTLRPRQNGRRFADDTFKCIFLNENVRLSIKISLKFVPNGQINNNPALVHIMAWHRSGNKPLCEPMKVSLLTHICVTRPQWVKNSFAISLCWPTDWQLKLSLKLLDRGRKIQNDIHINTYYCKPDFISWR